ncbi:metallophosphoesterase [Niabella sp. CC-SYL272]|uniref:metallophosphoesterase family protein n=1 Tax=Niabella agricola TaxID=2891571 RepID=UPI001F2C175C|nr:metallophosphoesterase [Niabella agricola]MCF3111185.1 metallophosphoesterase [Niabella agricola]
MNRKSFIKGTSLLTGSVLTGGMAAAGRRKEKPVLMLAHITDVHIRPGDNAPQRFRNCLKKIKATGIDFFLNTGDSIHDASYDHVKRDSVTEQWQLWDECLSEIKGYDIYSCLGNHDMWWAAPDKQDAMYGKDYVVKRLKIPHRYYSFTRGGWHFIVLDGNNHNISLDETQFKWLEDDLAATPAHTPTLIMSHYPTFGATPILVGGHHSDYKRLKTLLYKHKDKVRASLSGHNHLCDKTSYNGVWYCCNGAMSGFWWGQGDKESAGPGYYLETPPGYAILKLFKNGDFESEYIAHGF